MGYWNPKCFPATAAFAHLTPGQQADIVRKNQSHGFEAAAEQLKMFRAAGYADKSPQDDSLR